MEPMESNEMLRETYRLSLENNKMLHKMRRNAFWGGIIKFAFYFLILVVAPLWLYSAYLAPLVQSVQDTVSQVEGTNAKVQAQFGSLQDTWKQFQSKLPSFGSTTAQ
jgi:hypothetical protein